MGQIPQNRNFGQNVVLFFKKEQIVLERSARLNLDPGRGDYLIRVTGLTNDHL